MIDTIGHITDELSHKNLQRLMIFSLKLWNEQRKRKKHKKK